MVRLSQKLFAYDRKAGIWLTKVDMNQGRAETVLEAVNNKLFAIGGGDYLKTKTAAPSIEMLDIQENQWTIVENNPGFPCDSATLLVHGQNIVITGGYNYETKKLSNCIHLFNSESRKITTLESKLRI